MSLFSTTRRKVVTAGSILVVAGGLTAAGVASAAGNTLPAAAPSTNPTGASTLAATTHSTSTSGKADHRHHRHHRLHENLFSNRADYGTVQVHRHGAWVTYTLDRGTVTKVTATSITLHRPDGVTVSIRVGSSTRYGGMKGVKSATGVTGEATVKVGEKATVISSNGTAIRVAAHVQKIKGTSGTSSSKSSATASTSAT